VLRLREPMLARAGTIPVGRGWVFEPKLDATAPSSAPTIRWRKPRAPEVSGHESAANRRDMTLMTGATVCAAQVSAARSSPGIPNPPEARRATNAAHGAQIPEGGGRAAGKSADAAAEVALVAGGLLARVRPEPGLSDSSQGNTRVPRC
jgi:hypothetical protein